MPNYLLTAIKTEEGYVFICPKCQARGIAAVGTSDEGGRYLLICPILPENAGRMVDQRKARVGTYINR